MSATASQTTGVSIVYSTVCPGLDQRKHQSSASLAFVRGIHRWPVNSPNKGPVTWKMLPFDDVIMHDYQACHMSGKVMESLFCQSQWIARESENYIGNFGKKIKFEKWCSIPGKYFELYNFAPNSKTWKIPKPRLLIEKIMFNVIQF